MANRTQYCKKCGKVAIIESHVDVYYCPDCDQWTGERCKCTPENNCPYSLDKIPPFEKPSELAKWLAEGGLTNCGTEHNPS